MSSIKLDGLTLASTANSAVNLDSSVVFPAGGTGNPISVAVICDEKAYNVAGGNFATGDWRDRELNTEISDPDGIVSISSNQFTLQAGSYFIEWSAPAFATDRHFTRLYNITTATEVTIGTTMFAASADSGFSRSEGGIGITIASANVFKIQHQCQTTNASGFGLATLNTDASSRYTYVKISKLK